MRSQFHSLPRAQIMYLKSNRWSPLPNTSGCCPSFIAFAFFLFIKNRYTELHTMSAAIATVRPRRVLVPRKKRGLSVVGNSHVDRIPPRFCKDRNVSRSSCLLLLPPLQLLRNPLRFQSRACTKVPGYLLYQMLAHVCFRKQKAYNSRRRTYQR